MTDEREESAMGAHYSGVFHTDLDCDRCGGPFQVEGDVSNGQLVHCDNCGAELEVYGR